MGKVVKAAEVKTKPVPLKEKWDGPIIETFAEHRETISFFEESKQKIIELSMAMAKRIVGEVISLDNSLLDKIYQRSLDEVKDLGPVEIRVHPEDRGRSRIDSQASKMGFAVVSDPRVGRGGCVVSACGHHVDQSIDVVLNALREAMEQSESD